MSQLGIGMTSVPQDTRRGGGTGSTGSGGKAVALAALVIVSLVAGLVFAVVHWFANSPDYAGPGQGSVVVQIDPGDSVSQIALTLEKADVIRSASAFVDAAAGTEAFQPGSYQLKQQMRAADALALLLDPKSRVSTRITIREGLQLHAIIDQLSRATKIPVQQFQDALNRPASIGLPVYAGGNAEGILFPATYDAATDTNATKLLTAMVHRYDQAVVNTGLVEKSAALKLSPYQSLIVASIVQAEGRPEDYPKIARVILNRLAKGIPLQLDTTVLYALQRTDPPPSSAELKINSPYNTYRIAGLPPGPINSPGEQAISAVLAPAPGPWLYYVTVDLKTGETKFTDSYKEFLTFKAELKANSK